MSHSHVLYHNVLMWDQAVYTVMTPLPPVLRGSQVQQQRGPLLKGKFSRTSAHVVKFCYGLDLLHFCIATVTENILQFWLFCGLGRSLSSVTHLHHWCWVRCLPHPEFPAHCGGFHWTEGQNGRLSSQEIIFQLNQTATSQIFRHSYQYSSPPAMHFS